MYTSTSMCACQIKRERKTEGMRGEVIHLFAVDVLKGGLETAAPQKIQT